MGPATAYLVRISPTIPPHAGPKPSSSNPPSCAWIPLGRPPGKRAPHCRWSAPAPTNPCWSPDMTVTHTMQADTSTATEGLNDRSLGWLRFLWDKATTEDDWTDQGEP